MKLITTPPPNKDFEPFEVTFLIESKQEAIDLLYLLSSSCATKVIDLINDIEKEKYGKYCGLQSGVLGTAFDAYDELLQSKGIIP